jgi:hypothetical protein
MQLLETIGTVKKDKKKKDKYKGAYQESVTAPLGCEHDDNVVGHTDGDNGANDTPEYKDPELLLTEVLSAVEKVCSWI